MSLGYHPDLDVALDALLSDSSAAEVPMTSSTVVSAPPSRGDVRTTSAADLSRVPTRRLRAELRILRAELERRERIRHRMDSPETPNDGSTP